MSKFVSQYINEIKFIWSNTTHRKVEDLGVDLEHKRMRYVAGLLHASCF